MRAAIYCRQSRTRDGSESLDIQVQACQEAAERFGYEVAATLVEPPSTSGYTARGKNRAQFKELLRGFRERKFDMVMAYKTDRLSRGGGPGWAPLLEAIEAAGLNVDRAVATPSGFVSEFEIGIRAAMDREESKKLSERLLDVAGRRAAAGLRSGGGSRAYGFELDQMTLRESEVVVIKEIVRRVIAGHSYTEVAYWLNEQHIPTALGNQWIGLSVRNLLRRKHLAAIRSYNGVDYSATWPAIIDAETWERLQLELKLRRERKKQQGSPARKYLLTGLLYCGLCGNMMTGDKRPDHPGQPIKRNYVCRLHGSTQRQGGCGRVRRIAEPLEHFITEAVLYRLDSPELGKLLVAKDQDADKLNYLLGQRQYMAARLDELVLDYASGLLSRDQLAKAKPVTEAQLKALDGQLEALRRQSLNIDVPVGQTLHEAWTNAGSDEWRRKLLSLVVERVIIHPARKYPKYWIGDKLFKFSTDPQHVEIRWRDLPH